MRSGTWNRFPIKILWLISCLFHLKSEVILKLKAKISKLRLIELTYQWIWIFYAAKKLWMRFKAKPETLFVNFRAISNILHQTHRHLRQKLWMRFKAKPETLFVNFRAITNILHQTHRQTYLRYFYQH